MAVTNQNKVGHIAYAYSIRCSKERASYFVLIGRSHSEQSFHNTLSNDEMGSREINYINRSLAFTGSTLLENVTPI